MTTSSRPARGGSHGGRTISVADLRPGWWKAFQRSSQSSATSLVVTSTSAPPAAARRSGSAGSSPGAP